MGKRASKKNSKTARDNYGFRYASVSAAPTRRTHSLHGVHTTVTGCWWPTAKCAIVEIVQNTTHSSTQRTVCRYRQLHKPVPLYTALRRDVLPLLGREKMQFLNIATLHLLDSLYYRYTADALTANAVMARPGPGCGDWRKWDYETKKSVAVNIVVDLRALSVERRVLTSPTIQHTFRYNLIMAEMLFVRLWWPKYYWRLWNIFPGLFIIWVDVAFLPN